MLQSRPSTSQDSDLNQSTWTNPNISFTRGYVSSPRGDSTAYLNTPLPILFSHSNRLKETFQALRYGSVWFGF
ncbi:Uncharacterized protein TCM_030874 [Theobroma cacao]|uniref:Uncharacterized protein n=1 Tax=Theobroma cacao TaxID=3641 RepID=A0A061F638_THECC|nr:Uncharacterized protein TCM_030874 [Theobroma cacao]